MTTAVVIDFSKIKIVEADPVEIDRGRGAIISSPVTKLLLELEPGCGFPIPTSDEEETKKMQRNVNVKIKAVRGQHPGREYLTRTLHPGDKFDTAGKVTIKVLSLGVYRTK